MGGIEEHHGKHLVAELAELQLEVVLHLVGHIEHRALGELLRKRAWLVPALQAKGLAVLHSTATPENASGIVTFFKPEADMTALHAKLEAANIMTSLRADRRGQKYLRLSPHFYNTDEELHRVLETL